MAATFHGGVASDASAAPAVPSAARVVTAHALRATTSRTLARVVEPTAALMTTTPTATRRLSRMLAATASATRALAFRCGSLSRMPLLAAPLLTTAPLVCRHLRLALVLLVLTMTSTLRRSVLLASTSSSTSGCTPVGLLARTCASAFSSGRRTFGAPTARGAATPGRSATPGRATLAPSRPSTFHRCAAFRRVPTSTLASALRLLEVPEGGCSGFLAESLLSHDRCLLGVCLPRATASSFGGSICATWNLSRTT
jgi:hypothetical protein